MRTFVLVCLVLAGFAAPLNAQSDLAVTKSDGEDPVALGTNITYAIFLINNGPAPATNVVLTDTLPPNVTFQSLEAPENWTCNAPQLDTPGGLLNCSNTNIAAGETVGFSVIVRPTAVGVVINSVNTTSTESDPYPENNSQSEQTTVVATTKPSRICRTGISTFELVLLDTRRCP